MRYKFTYLLCCLLYFSNSLFAQQKLVTGKVTDAKSEPLIGVTVKIKNGKSVVSTDVNGKFSIKAASSDILVFTYVSFTTKEVPVGNQTNMAVTLTDSYSNLNEVVVVGYGTQKKVNLTGSISVLDSAFLKNRPITNSSQALQGANGVYVNQTSSQPGADNATIRIRGLGTLNDNSPLILIDGIEGDLRDLNPDDIASISVLKDAASASIYGNRAANGVVLVSTKKGRKGDAQIEYSGYYGLSTATFLPDVVTNTGDWLNAFITARKNDGVTDNAAISALASYNSNPSAIPNTNWFDEVFRTASSQNHNLRVSGGSDKSTYTVALNYQDQDGIMVGSSGKKYSFSTNLTNKVNKWLDVDLGLFGTKYDTDESLLDPYNMMYIVYRALPFQQPFVTDPHDGVTYYADQPYKLNNQNVFRNPYALATEGMNRNTTNRLQGNLTTTVKLPLNISYKLTGGINYYNNVRSLFAPNIEMYNPQTDAFSLSDYFITSVKPRSAARNTNNNLNLTMFQTLNWETTINKDHHLKALGGYSLETMNTQYFSSYIDGFISDNLTDIDAGSTNPAVTGNTASEKLQSFFGRLNYDFKSKYLFEANFRYDGSSKFAPGKRWGFFPSVSAGWRLSEEDYFKQYSWLENLKLRASYGQLGNQRISNFQFANNYNVGGYSLANLDVPAVWQTNYADPNISWETTTIANAGIESSFFKGMLSFDADYYVKTTDNILQQTVLGSIVGNLTGPVKNIGKVQNKGIEITLGHKNKIGNFRYDVSVNAAYNQNKVLKLNGGQPLITGTQIIKEGSPINSYYILHSIGIFQTAAEVAASPVAAPGTQPGDLKYEDVNGDGKIDNNDRIVVGSSVPKYTYGINIGAGYGNFDLRIFAQGVQGVSSLPAGILDQPFRGGGGLTKKWVTDSWTPENPGATLPRLQVAASQSNYNQNALSTFWLQSGSYLRVKNVQLGYTLPGNYATKIGLKKLYVYVNGQNLFTVTQNKNVDPERSITSDRTWDYPTAKTYSVGLNATF